MRVNDLLLEAAEIFINVGGRALVPDMPGLDGVPYVTNSSMMNVDFLPEHLLIIGGSYIGLEFAQMYRRFGSQVTVIEMGPRPIGREDVEISAMIQSILEDEGIAFRLNSKCVTVERRGDQIAAGLSWEEEPREVVGSHLLLAVGRVPNTDDLGLDKAGVATMRAVISWSMTNCAPMCRRIWALGDANGEGAFTHTAFNDYEIVAGQSVGS